MSASSAAMHVTRKALASLLLPTTSVGAATLYLSHQQEQQKNQKDPITSTRTNIIATNAVSCEAATATKVPVSSPFNKQDILQQKKAKVHIQKRMTSIGRFSLKTETASHPSVPTFFLALSNTKVKVKKTRGSGNNESGSSEEEQAAAAAAAAAYQRDIILNPSKATLTPAEFEQTWFERKMPSKHPRFHQRVSSTKEGYFEAEKDLDESRPSLSSQHGPNSSGASASVVMTNHIQEKLHPMVYRQDLKQRIEELVSTAMDVKKSLWEVHISSGPLGRSGAISREACDEIYSRNGTDNGSSTGSQEKEKETILLFKCHHSLGDAVSLSASIGDLVDEANEIKEKIKAEIRRRRNQGKNKSALQKMLKLLQSIIMFLLGSLQALLRHGYLLLTTRTNPWHTVLGLTPAEGEVLALSLGRSVSWYDNIASVEEVKNVAKLLGGPKATVNDVFVSCVTAAVARQLEEHRKRILVQKSIQGGIGKEAENSDCGDKQSSFNVVIPSHLAGGIIPPGRGVGNLIGAFVARVPGEMGKSIRPSERLALVHDELYKVKRSPAAILSFGMAKLMASYFPERLAVRLFQSSSANAAVAVTNSRGPEEKVHINGRPVEALNGFLPLPPGLPVGVVVGSYNSKVSLSLNADKFAIPDADKFLGWVLDEYHLLVKEAALKKGVKA